jgi:hypothetical protein
MKKLTGSDIIAIMRSSSKNVDVLKEAQNLTLSDFDTDDITVRFFLNAFPDGFKSASIYDEKLRNAATNTLENIKKEIEGHALRKAYNLLQNNKFASNVAVKLESAINEESSNDSLASQVKSAEIIKFLSKYASGYKNREMLTCAYSNINEGHIHEALSLIHKVYENFYPEKNIKTAFVTLKNQMGEGYQLCPKGIYIWGQPRPMALSNCREHCIDARLNPDGTVGCNYLKWLNNNLITQEQTKNLFDTIKVAQETMNLEKGQRTKFPMSDQDSLDTHIRRNDDLINKPWETQLAGTHKIHENLKPQKPKAITTDAAIEILLKETRDVFDDDELDNLEAEIRKAMGD